MADISTRDTGDIHPGESSEKEIKSHAAPARSTNLLGEGSPGVRRIEIVASHFRFIDRVLLFCSIFLVAYVYGLDGTVRNTYQVSIQHSIQPVRDSQAYNKDLCHLALCYTKLWKAQSTRNCQCPARCHCRSGSGNVFNYHDMAMELTCQFILANCCQDCRCFWQSRTHPCLHPFLHCRHHYRNICDKCGGILRRSYHLPGTLKILRVAWNDSYAYTDWIHLHHTVA